MNKKIWLCGDVHLGKNPLDSAKWLRHLNDYFYNFFIEEIKSKYKDGHECFFLGDIFDSRVSINLEILNFGVRLFEDLSKILPVKIILGNHDMLAMKDTTINSLCAIRNIPNVTVYDKPTWIDLDGKSALMMPWQNGSEKEILESKGGDLLFAHSDLKSAKTQINVTRPINKSLPDIEWFKGFKRVYASHIHLRQTIDNMTYIGSPYHLCRSDIGNKKGIYVHDVDSNRNLFIENNISPEYDKLIINSELDLTNIMNNDYNNKLIDIIIKKSVIASNPKIKAMLDLFSNKHKVEEISYIDDLKTSEVIANVEDIDLSNLDIKSITYEACDNIALNKDIDILDEIDLKENCKLEVEKIFNIYAENVKR